MTVNDQDKWRDDTDRPREDYPPTISARAAYGGIKWGSAFFGWLSAMGLAVLLTALLAAVGGPWVSPRARRWTRLRRRPPRTSRRSGSPAASAWP